MRGAHTPPQECSAICNLIHARRSRAARSPRSAAEGRSIPEEGYGCPSSPRDRQEGFRAILVLLRPVVLGAAVLALGEALFGIRELLFEGAAVEVVRRDCLLQ